MNATSVGKNPEQIGSEDSRSTFLPRSAYEKSEVTFRIIAVLLNSNERSAKPTGKVFFFISSFLLMVSISSNFRGRTHVAEFFFHRTKRRLTHCLLDGVSRTRCSQTQCRRTNCLSVDKCILDFVIKENLPS